MSSPPDWLSSALNYTEDRLEEQNIDIDDYVEKVREKERLFEMCDQQEIYNIM